MAQPYHAMTLDQYIDDEAHEVWYFAGDKGPSEDEVKGRMRSVAQEAVRRVLEATGRIAELDSILGLIGLE